MILRLFLVLRSQCNCLNGNNSFYNSIAQFCCTGYYYIFRTMRFVKVSIIFLVKILAKYQRGNNETV